jgi:mono/diheme cytochrome c family protein
MKLSRAFLALAIPASAAHAADATPSLFTDKIQPLFAGKCVSCHNPEKTKGKLQMHTAAALAAGGDSGPAIVPGKPDDSLLLQRISLPAGHDDIMPPEGDPVTPEEIAAVRSWITEGAAFPPDLTITAASPKPARPPKESITKVRSMAVYPDKITLETARDFQSFVAIATFDDDVTQDVTPKAKIALADPSLARMDGARLFPLKDGSTTLTVQWHDQTVTVPLEVKAATTDRPVSFNLDVMPVFMRDNCNTGSCHGAARGQDGFRLSLFGFDPKGDHFRLTQELSGRRINLSVPEESLLITKSINSVPHTGGKRMEADSPNYRTLVEWITNGTPYDDEKTLPTVTSVDIFPKTVVLEGEGSQLQFTVRATYSDGHNRDITPLAVFISNNDPTAKVSKDGLVTAAKRGEAFVMARYDTFTVGSQVIVIPDALQYEKPKLAEHNYIDALVHDKLHRLRILPSDVCDDATFIRRVFLDVVGLLPTEEESAKFFADASPDKRTKLIDDLLSRKEFTEMWVMKWAELLQIRTNPTNQVSYKATLLYYNWLKERISSNVPFNKIVQELLGSNGGTFTNPATNYYQIERDTLKVSENVAQVFMGMRLQCAQCHNHPFDRWTMNDYYGFASFFSQIGRKQAEDPRETVVFNAGGGEVNHIVTKAPQKPKFLGAEEPDLTGKDRRAALVEWMASPRNPYFATNLSNIMWAHFFGVGIIDPVDDVRISNPASNPELLAALGSKLTEYNYDFRKLVRDICSSRTYQLSSRVNDSNADDEKNFSHALIRRQRAEVMLDTISQVTETKNKFQGLPLGARAVQIADGNVSTYFLRTFGRAERATVCSCEVKMDPNLGQALHLLNGDVTQSRIAEGQMVKKLLTAGQAPLDVLDSLYLRCFARKPTAGEIKPVSEALAATPEEAQAILEDVFWALLNSKEFMFNH